MLNRHVTAPRSSIPRMVAVLALIGIGTVWLLTRVRPDRTRPSPRPMGGHAAPPRAATTPQVPPPAEPLWESVAGEEDPGAAVEPPPPAQPPTT